MFDRLLDFVKFVEVYGVFGIRVILLDEVDSVILKVLEVGRLIVIDFVIDKDEKVLLIVLFGVFIDEIID